MECEIPPEKIRHDPEAGFRRGQSGHDKKYIFYIENLYCGEQSGQEKHRLEII
jgi:hypothetical protein